MAVAIAAFSLDSPRKYSPNERPFLDKKHSFSPNTLDESEAEAEDDLDTLRKKFVGEVDLPECELLHWFRPTNSICFR